MMNLFASVFAGMGMLFGGMFGVHHAALDDNGSTTPRGDHMSSTTPFGDHHDGEMMGSTTPHGGAPVVIGKVVSISGTSLTVSGRSGDAATTTYSVDASAAKIYKGKMTASSTPATISNVLVGDNVLIMGTVSGTSVTAKTIVDGLGPMRMGIMPTVRPGMHISTSSMMHRGENDSSSPESPRK